MTQNSSLKWNFILFNLKDDAGTDSFVKGHYVIPDLSRDQTIQDILEKYNAEPFREEECEAARLDPGGMAKINPEVIEITMPTGHLIRFDLLHTMGVLRMLSSAKEKPDEMVKIYGQWNCVVIPKDWLPILKSAVEKQLSAGDATRQQMLEDLQGSPNFIVPKLKESKDV